VQFLDFPSKGSDKETDSFSINPLHILSFHASRDAGGSPLVVVLMMDGSDHSIDISYTDFQKKLREVSFNSTTYISNHYHAQEGMA